MRAAVAVICVLAAAAHGSKILEDGQEYTLMTETAAASGTMDHNPSSAGFSYKYKTRIQVHGNRINVELSEGSFSQYTGSHKASDWPFDRTQFQPIPALSQKFAIERDSAGLFKRLIYPSGADVKMVNMIKSWAANLQMDDQQLAQGSTGFKTKEKMLQGNCYVTYTQTENSMVKSTSHMQDCDDLVYRMVDDWRGYRCDSDEHGHRGSPEGLYSNSNTAYGFGKVNGKKTLKYIAGTGTVMAQFFETEGVSHFAFTNSTSIVVSQKSSPGDISVSGDSTDDLRFVWSDAAYKWNTDRDLKAKEPFFSTGNYFEDDQSVLKQIVLGMLNKQQEILDNYSHSKEAVNDAHKYGVNSILPNLYGMDYNTLKSIYDTLSADSSDSGVMKANMFNELLGTTGTSASALLIRDLILNNKLPNTRDGGRVLSAVPFHIRRPSKKLVGEFEQLLNLASAERGVKMAIPLTYGHLVRMTCERAGASTRHPEVQECFNSFAKAKVDEYYGKFLSASNHEDRSLALSVIMNIRYGGVGDKLKDLIYGKTDVKCNRLRTLAVWAAAYDVLSQGKGSEYYMPIFADNTLSHELRMAAVSAIFYGKPTVTDLNNIMVVLYMEKDYEVINYVFTLLEKYSNTIDPCDKSKSEVATYFLKYLRQWSEYETDWGFGVSKTYTRQFQQKKYGYGGAYNFYTHGSHRSTTPLAIGMSISNNIFHTYTNQMIAVHLRMEGLAKGLIRKLKSMDVTAWKTADLQKILSSDMNIRERPDQKVHVELIVMLKGTVVIHRHYDEDSVKEGGKLSDFMNTMKSLEDTYAINHQRIFQVGSLLFEQPTNVGVPMAYMNSAVTMAHVQAKVKKGNHRGLMFRDVNYDLHLFTQGVNIMFLANPLRKTSYGVIQDRVYHSHFPRSFVIGLNPVKKEFKLSVKRPAYDKPLMMMMHSYTYVVARSNSARGDLDLSAHCPTCAQRVVVSLGPDNVKSREIFDVSSDKGGFNVKAEYFDCEMNLNRGFTSAKAIGAFMPYNKNPKTPWTSLMMGLRQIRAFFIYFPRAEQCGAYLRWSQSRNNPVKELEISVRANVEENGERLFFRGRKWFVKAIVKAKGEPVDRQYRINFSYEFTPGYLENNVKVQLQRAESSFLPAYSICASYESKYPDFSPEWLGYDKSSDMEVTGKARVQYGKSKNCDNSEGEMKVTFKHATTQAARADMQNTWYYKQCMQDKNTAAWSNRGDRLPVTEACYMTVWDATTARKYHWNVDFVKLTDRMRNIISQVQSVIKAGYLPWWDMDPEGVPVSNTSPHMTVDLEVKNNDKAVDIRMETSQGASQFHDVPLRLNWFSRMRNLKFTKTIRRLMNAKILNPCVATSETVRTMDNVTYSYNPTSCWTLTSAHCGPKPSYAVFTKKSSGLPLAARAYFGGHLVEFIPSGPKKINVKINGSPLDLQDQKEKVHSSNGQEIFKIFKWGSTYNVYSFLKVWVVYDGHFLEVIPAPSVKGQHCGLCGNYNRNKKDEFTAKDESQLANAEQMVENWKWKC